MSIFEDLKESLEYLAATQADIFKTYTYDSQEDLTVEELNTLMYDADMGKQEVKCDD